MRRHRFGRLWLSILFPFLGILPTTADARVILDRSHDSVSLGSSYVYLVERQNPLLVQDILQRKDHEFSSPVKPGQTELGFQKSAVWLKYELENKDHPETNWFFELWSVPTESAELYIFNKNQFVHQTIVGKHIPQTLTRASYYGLQIQVPKGQTRTAYLRILSNHRMRAPIALYTADALILRDYEKQWIMGLFFGIGIALVLYNLFLFLSIRDESYFWYVITSLATWVLLFGENGYVDFYWSYFLPRSWSDLSFLMILLNLMSALVFTRYFLNVRSHLPTFDKIFAMLIFFLGALSVFSALKPEHHTLGWIVDVVALMCIAFMTLVGTLLLKIKYSPARYYLLSWSMVFIGVLIWLAEGNGLVPTSALTRYAVELGVAAEMILMSLGLAERTAR